MNENVQRRSTKLIPGYFHLSYPERMRKLKMPTLSYHRTCADMIQVFKLRAKEGGNGQSLPCILTPGTNEDHDLHGHNKKLFVKSSTKDVRKYFFTNRIFKVWNRFPQHDVSSQDIMNFEKNLDSFGNNHPLLHDDYTAQIQTGNPKFLGP